MATPWFISRWSGKCKPAWASTCPLIYITLGLPVAFIALMTMTPAQAQTSSATYSVTFRGNWTTESTPGGVASGAHFTTLIGAVHNDMVTFWEPGGTATTGVEWVAELGITTTFRSEVAAAGANASVVSKSIGGSPTVTATFEIEVTNDHPLFTLLSMIGPSPDWFVGVSSLSLLDDQGEWLSDFEVDLFPYDAGTENGNGFSLTNTPTSPQGTITSIKGTGKFSDEPMAMLSFEFQEPEETNTAPTFTGSVSFSVQENSTTVGTVQATDSDDADSVTGYTIETGGDGALFSLTSGGALTFKAAPNYEDPQDAGGNNRYDVTVRATSGTGAREMSADQMIVVTVTDDNTEAPDVPDRPSVSGASASSLTVSWDEPGNDGPPITDYDYQYRISMPLENWTEVTNTQITGLSTTISGLPENTTYDVQVLAKNAEGSSDWSFSGTGATQISAPGQVTGVSVNEEVEQLAVSWSVVSGANGYKVQWKSGVQEYNTTDRQHEVTGGSTTGYTITGLTAGTGYTVQVIATKDNAADGTASAEETGTPLASTPGQVTGVSVNEEVEQLAVSWSVVSGASGYKVQWKSGAQDYNTTDRQHEVTSGSTTGYTITGLTPGTGYTVQVIATKDNAADGPASVEMTATPLAPLPGQVTGVSVTEQVEQLAVSWDAMSGARGYKVQWKSGAQDYNTTDRQHEVTGGSTTGYTITDLTPGTGYTVQVIAMNNNAADGPASVEMTATPLAPFGPVTGISVTEQVERLAVSWNAMSGANGYKVQWKSGAQNYNTTDRQHEVTSGSRTNYTITGLTAGVEYTVRVIATRDNAADGPASAEITDTPLAQPPPPPPPPPPPSTIADAPENLQAFAGNAQVILSWNAPSNDGGADITGYAYRYKESGGDFIAYTDIPESGPGEANARSYTVTGLTNGLEYVFHVQAVNEHGGGLPEEVTVTLPSRVSTENEELPTEVALLGNYPNPFNPETTIRYALPQAGNVRLAVYDLLGQEVAVLVDEPKPAGHHTTRFDAGDLPSGAYVYRLQAQDKIMVQIMILVK